jgi:hypothetical protein
MKKNFSPSVNEGTPFRTFLTVPVSTAPLVLSKVLATRRLAVHFSHLKMTSSQFQYDFAVIGGGSGGMAAAKKAAKHGARVVLFDFVEREFFCFFGGTFSPFYFIVFWDAFHVYLSFVRFGFCFLL